MPRISLYKPEKGEDYTFLDQTIAEMFTVGGTDVFVHKYLGPVNPDEEDATATQPRYNAVKETNIQDLLFLENRDRKYDPNIYQIRGIYNVSDIDFDMSQFGLFLQNDTIFLTVHINSSVKTIGRKLMSGDVIELPHLKDQYALNDYKVALKRFYVIQDINRAAEGFSPTWYPHLYRLKLKQIVDSQEFKEILDLPAEEGSENTLRDVITKLEPDLFKAVTGLTVKDFDLLVSLGVFNSTHMNQAVFAFRRYEDSSLSYTGIDSHPKLRHYGLYDTVVAAEEISI